MAGGLRALAAALCAGERSARAECEARLARIRAHEDRVRAWAAIDEARALALADRCDARRDAALASGRPLAPLHGVPIGVKDIFDTADLPTEFGTPVLRARRPARNARAVERLLEAGAYVMGKTVTTEFAFLHPGRTRNPWNPAHTPGGSSSGSAAAVAAGFVPGAIGSQTNGSVIRPAAFCGVVGFKPSFDLLPYAGALAFSPTLDHVGVFTRSVGDAATLAAALAAEGAICGEPRQRTAPPRIAFLARFPWCDAEPEAAASLRSTLALLAAAGATLEEIRLSPVFETGHEVLRTIMLHEAARGLAAHQSEHRGEISATLNAALDEGAAIATREYAGALARRGALRERAFELFERCDVVASLPAPGPAPARLDITGDPSFCTLWSLVGFPSITLPAGVTAAGLPLGIQLAGAAGADDALLQVAAWCESAIGFDRVPF